MEKFKRKSMVEILKQAASSLMWWLILIALCIYVMCKSNKKKKKRSIKKVERLIKKESDVKREQTKGVCAY